MSRPSTPDALTLLTATSAARRLQLFRHQVETAAARIGADCERMLRNAHQPDRAAWRDAIGQALLAGRHAASLAQAPMPAGEDAAERHLAALEKESRDAMQRIVDAMTMITRTVAVALDDELLVADAQSVRNTAIALQSVSSRGSGSVPLPVSAPPPEPSASDLVPEDGSATILVAEDNRQIQKTLERMLTKLGYQVTLADDGRAALELARGTAFDLILTDIEMPEMNGIELLRELKASTALQHIPVVVVSSLTDLDTVVQSIALGADDHISKPFQQALLQARVRSSLLRKRMRDAELDHLRRVGQIAAAAEAVDRDAYVPGSLAQVASGRDQLGHLARVFERMVVTMKSREERLAHRLRRLRLELGEVSSTGARQARKSDESPFGSGQRIGGRYEIVDQIGRGGMGIVYHARDLELHEDVALKVVRVDVIKEDATFVDRLKTEIKLLRKLSHENVLRAHDLGEADGYYYISMEYVRGVSLLEMLDQKGRISVDATIALGTQLADALAVAHASEIIHRDIKPANLLMDERGVLKVMDFGLARTVKAEKGHTQRGTIVGTPLYMAPEQLMGGELDARSDLFAVGIVLYECLTGRPPFLAESPVALVAQMIDGEYPRLAECAPEVPRSLATVVEQLLMLKPEERIQKAADLSRRLAEIEPHDGTRSET